MRVVEGVGVAAVDLGELGQAAPARARALGWRSARSPFT